MSFTVALDFDDTLADKWMQPQPNALLFVHRLHRSGATLFVHSCRANHDAGMLYIHRWLEEHGFPRMAVVPKPHADVYVDDKGLVFETWGQAYPAITRRKGHR